MHFHSSYERLWKEVGQRGAEEGWKEVEEGKRVETLYGDHFQHWFCPEVKLKMLAI